jgi:hypothetical protein
VSVIWKVTSNELIQQRKKKKYIYIQKNMAVLQPLLNVVTARTEALAILGNKFLHACVKEICCLLAQARFDTIRQLLFTVEVL